MSFEDAMKRLAGCRKLQPTEMQVIVSADIVDALIASHDTRFSEVQTGPQNVEPPAAECVCVCYGICAVDAGYDVSRSGRYCAKYASP